MAVTQNTYTGNGSTTNYSFTFPYLETTDIKVSVNGTNTTAYTLANATTIQFNTAPANGAAIRIYRQTDDAALAAAFYPGSAIRSADLNDNFTQNLYVTQEANNNAASATSTANTALSNSSTAITTANSAVSTANTASSNASAAVATANTANSNASAAVSTANTASSNATTAVNTANAATATANSAASTAANALSTANAATSTANSASTAATNAVNTANAASSAASSAVSTANTASANASNAVTTANTASSTATSAVNTANSALSTANAAASAVANAILYDIVANVAAIPGTPANNDAVEVTNSTGIESFTPLTGLPAGFVGSSGLAVRLVYTTTGNTWTWIQYFPNDPESRYLKLSGGTLTGQLKADDSTSVASPVLSFDGDTNTGIAHTGADELALVTGGTARLTIDPAGGVAITNGLNVGGQTAVVTNDARLSNTRTPTDGTVTDAKVAANAAIAGTKISPNFGTQPITTTGTLTSDTVTTTGAFQVSRSGSAAGVFSDSGSYVLNDLSAGRFIPTGSIVPSNGLYLPAANSVAISTNGTGRLFVDASGNLLVGTSSSGSQSGTFGQSLRGNNPGLTFIGTEASGAIRTIYESAGNLIFWNGTGGTEIARFDSSGRLGIGTSAPNQALEVVGSQWLRGAYSTNTALAFVGNSGVGRDFAITRSAASTMSLEMSGRNAFNIVGNTGNTNCYFTFSGQSSLEHMRLDENGRLLVGTSSASTFFAGASCNLQVQSTASAFALGIERATADASGGFLVFRKTRGTSPGSNTTVSSGDDIGSLTFAATDGADSIRAAQITASVDGTPGANDMPGRLVFSTTADGASSPTERMRITQAGDVFINHTSSTSPIVGGEKFGVVGGSDFAIAAKTTLNTKPTIYIANTSDTNNAYVARFSTGAGGNTRGEIYYNGSQLVYATSSDYRLKENVASFDDGIEIVKQLRPVKYNWIENGNEDIGFIAHEVQAVFPNAVGGEKDAVDENGKILPQTYDPSKLVPLLTAALQEAIGRIETLEAEVAALKAQ